MLEQRVKKLNCYQQKVIIFLLGVTYFPGDDDYQNVLVFAPILNSLVLDNHKKVIN